MALQIRQHSFNPAPWLVTMTIGVLLVALATPGLISLYTARPATALVSELTTPDADHTSQELQTAVQELEAAFEYEPGRRQHTNEQTTLLLNLYYKLKSSGREVEAIGFLEQASLVITRSLKFAPSDANLWYLLAETRALQGKMDRKTRRILNMSYLSGPREGWIALRRLQFSLRYWLLLGKDLRRHVKKEIRTLWSTPSYQRTFIRKFSSSSVRARRVIFAQIKTYGDEDIQKFQKLAKQARWKLIF